MQKNTLREWDVIAMPGFFKAGRPSITSGLLTRILAVLTRKQGSCQQLMLKVMKLTVLLLTVVFLSVYATGVSQTVTFSGKDVPLENVFPAIKKQTGYLVSANRDMLRAAHPVSVAVVNMPLKDFLQLVLKDQRLNFTIENKTIFIIQKEVSPSAKRDTTQQVRNSLVGRIVAQDGKPVARASIHLKNAKAGTQSDENGRFRFGNVDNNEILVITSVGFEPLQIPVRNFANTAGVTGRISNGVTELNIMLQFKASVLNETVITTGYGNYRKGNYTGAVTTVKAADIMTTGVSTIDQMLEGVVPGLFVNTPTGQVGASARLRVRGTSTLLGSQEPVWVVDGVIQTNPNSYENTNFTTNEDDIRELAGTAISWLNPYDIETITVLKDASATAIYGSKAANGVIVITTKKAQAGKISVNYAGDFSIGQRPRYGLYSQMNSAELMQYSRENYDDRAPFQPGIIRQGYAGLIYKMINNQITLEEMNRQYHQMANQNTDYFDALFRDALSYHHSLSVSGGSDILQNRTSFSFDNQLGEAKGNNLGSFNAVSNTTLRASKKLTVDLSVNGTYRKVDGFAYGVNPFGYAYNTARIYPLYNNDGSFFYYQKMGTQSTAVPGLVNYNYNIVNERDNTGSTNATWSWNTILAASWKILPFLEYRGTFGFASSAARTDKWATELSYYITNIRGYEYGNVMPGGIETQSTRLPDGGLYYYNTNTANTITSRNVLVYDRLIKNLHKVTVSLGTETRSVKTSEFSQDRYGYLKYRGNTFANPPLTYYPLGNKNFASTNESIAIGSTLIAGAKNNYLSEFGQMIYTYDNRYTLNATARLDASNRFGQFNNRRFSPVWSIGAKWSVANEKPLRENAGWMDVLDVYGSYGYQGQAVESISPYLTATYDGILSGYGVNGLRVNKLPYPDLGWQKTSSWNIGLDAGFLKGRIIFNGNVYKKISHVYNTESIPYENGANSDVVSGSIIENNGYEASLQIIPVRSRNFTWTVSANSSVNHNKVRTHRSSDSYNDYLTGKANISGDAYSTFYSYQFAGLNPDDGTPLFLYMDVSKPPAPFTSSLNYLVPTGRMLPDISGGFSTSFRYRSFTAGLMFAYQFGAANRLPAIYDYSNYAGTPDAMGNVNRHLFHRWRKPGDENIAGIYPSVPGISNVSNIVDVGRGDYRNRYELYAFSDARTASTDMIRCRSITLGYDFSQQVLKRLPVHRLAIKASMTNPFMWVSDNRWEGLDPSTADWPARRISSISVQMSL